MACVLDGFTFGLGGDIEDGGLQFPRYHAAVGVVWHLIHPLNPVDADEAASEVFFWKDARCKFETQGRCQSQEKPDPWGRAHRRRAVQDVMEPQRSVPMFPVPSSREDRSHPKV